MKCQVEEANLVAQYYGQQNARLRNIINILLQTLGGTTGDQNDIVARVSGGTTFIQISGVPFPYQLSAPYTYDGPVPPQGTYTSGTLFVKMGVGAVAIEVGTTTGTEFLLTSSSLVWMANKTQLDTLVAEGAAFVSGGIYRLASSTTITVGY